MKHESKHKKHQPVADASVHSVHYTEAEIASMKANQTKKISHPLRIEAFLKVFQKKYCSEEDFNSVRTITNEMEKILNEREKLMWRTKSGTDCI